MSKSLNLSLTEELRAFVDSRTGDHEVYTTPSEYIRALIRQDMQSQETVRHVLAGIDDLKKGRLSKKSILYIHDET